MYLIGLAFSGGAFIAANITAAVRSGRSRKPDGGNVRREVGKGMYVHLFICVFVFIVYVHVLVCGGVCACKRKTSVCVHLQFFVHAFVFHL